jgi:hypothetical protein
MTKNDANQQREDLTSEENEWKKSALLIKV